MKLIVGLGDPGKEYAATRHNVGFMVVDQLAVKWNVEIKKEKFEALYHEVNQNGEKAVLIKPQTYMNLSGNSLRKWIDYYKVDPTEEMVIIYDDLDMPTGKIRLRIKGSSGGHNGIKSIISNIGTQEFFRIKIGIGRPVSGGNIVDYVLSPFAKQELEMIHEAVKTASEIAEKWLDTPFPILMNNYNK